MWTIRRSRPGWSQFPDEADGVRTIAARAAAFAAVVVIGVLAVPGVASAHVYFRGSTPPDGTSLAVAPKVVTLDWSSDVELQYATAQLTDLAGHAIALPAIQLDPIRSYRVVVTLPPLQAQAYRLTFSVRDQVDLHRTTGSISFAVGGAVAPPPTRPPHPPPAAAEVAMRWVARIGMFLGIGALVVAFVILPAVVPAGAGRRRLTRRLLGVSLLAALLALAGDTAVLAYDANGIGSLWPTLRKILTESAYGRRWQAEVVWTLALVLCVAWLREQLRRGVDIGRFARTRGASSSRGPRYIAAAACCFAVAQAVTVALSSHSSASGGQSPVGIALRSVHLTAVGVWIGGLAVLVIAFPALRKAQQESSADASPSTGALLRAFSPVAAGGLAVVTVTGLLLSGTEIATVTALLTTWYGWILLAKLTLVGAVVLLGLRHRRLVSASRRSASAGIAGGVRSSLVAEVGIATVVVALGAALGASLPARGPQFAKAPTPIPTQQTTNARDLVVTVALSPNFPGSDLVSAQVVNTRRPVPAPISAVTMTLTPADSPPVVVHLKRTSLDHWDGGQQTLRAGALIVDVAVERSGLPTTNGRLDWTVNPVPQWHQGSVVSSVALAPISTGLAVAVALGAVTIVIARRRRRPTNAGGGPGHRHHFATSRAQPVAAVASGGDS
jgi:copper transport protein